MRQRSCCGRSTSGLSSGRNRPSGDWWPRQPRRRVRRRGPVSRSWRAPPGQPWSSGPAASSRPTTFDAIAHTGRGRGPRRLPTRIAILEERLEERLRLALPRTWGVFPATRAPSSS